MLADLSKFKVVYNNRVLNAIALEGMDCGQYDYESPPICQKPKKIAILVVNEDGNLEIIDDEAWCFQFIPIVNGERSNR
jgi:hypothetical protein